MRFGMNLPGPFWVSWRVGGRRRRSRRHNGSALATLLMIPVWLIVALVWVNWQLLRGLTYITVEAYRFGSRRLRADAPTPITADDRSRDPAGTAVVVQLEIQQLNEQRDDPHCGSG